MGWHGAVDIIRTRLTIIHIAAIQSRRRAWTHACGNYRIALALKGWNGIKELFRPLLWGRVGYQWYLVAFLGMALLAGVGLVFLFLLNGTTPAWGQFGPVFMLAPIFLINLLSNVWEEIGWRGFALPRLQVRYSALTASIYLGVLWAVWHFPLLLDPNNAMSNFPWYVMMVNMAAMSVIYAWIYNSTRGSLLLVTLFPCRLEYGGIWNRTPPIPGIPHWWVTPRRSSRKTTKFP
jgi:membrane protease YdiL (CAAX protease family)